MIIRKAAIADVPAIHGLLRYYGGRGELLARSLSQLYDHLRDFWVHERPGGKKSGGRIAGCCALQFCWKDQAEIRSLAVYPEYHGNGIGARLMAAAEEEARSNGITRLIALTYRPGFFARFGYRLIDHAEIPLKVWSDCISCVNFPNCDENAMAKDLPPLFP
ncbi:MAG: GNAT family N-acetyltransferase [Desulfobacterales bacterium]|nr:MAG: GNAT family N-acetyltransferase [Desulfobacterales bacterium]